MGGTGKLEGGGSWKLQRNKKMAQCLKGVVALGSRYAGEDET